MLHLFIRFAGLGARFLLAIYIVRFLDLRGMGMFGIISTVVSISPSVLGFGINYFLNRDIVGLSQAEAGARIRDRLVFSFFLCLLAILIAQLWFGISDVPAPDQIFLIYSICCLETIATDLHNCLVCRNMLLLANFLFFIRSASWVFIYIAVGLVWPEFRSLSALLHFWHVALIVNFLLTGIFLKDWPWRAIHEIPSDFRRLANQIREGGLIYLSDLANIPLQVCDRFIVIWMLGLESTGIFVFFWSFANAVHNLTWVVAVQPSLPKLVSARQKRGLSGWREEFRSEIGKASGFGFAISTLVFLGVVVMLPYLHVEKLSSQLPLLLALSIYTVTRIAADVVGYGLYSLNLDRDYAFSVLIGSGLNPFAIVLGITLFGIQGAGVAMIVVSVVIFLMRLRSILRYLGSRQSQPVSYDANVECASASERS